MDNGQYEVAPLEPAVKGPSAAAAAPAATPTEGRPKGEERGRRGRGRGRGRGREREGAEEPRAPGAPPSEETRRPVEAKRPPERTEGLTLARGFELMRRALGELPSPIGHEALRLRMSALHGRQDTLLEPDRFSRLLRQAHDAEVADVRKVGEAEFDVVARGLEVPAVVSAAPAGPEQAGVSEPSPQPTTAEVAARGGIRFRRGARLPATPPAIAMVGVVSLDDEEPVVERPARGGRKKAAKTAVEPEEESGAREPAARKKSSPRGRAKKKDEG
jgi:hypothetical protein